MDKGVRCNNHHLSSRKRCTTDRQDELSNHLSLEVLSLPSVLLILQLNSVFPSALTLFIGDYPLNSICQQGDHQGSLCWRKKEWKTAHPIIQNPDHNVIENCWPEIKSSVNIPSLPKISFFGFWNMCGLQKYHRTTVECRRLVSSILSRIQAACSRKQRLSNKILIHMNFVASRWS